MRAVAVRAAVAGLAAARAEGGVEAMVSEEDGVVGMGWSHTGRAYGVHGDYTHIHTPRAA